jgi:hypothetical protein
MKTSKNKNLPRITLILQKENDKQYIRPSVRRTQYFLNNKAEHYLKIVDSITIRVVYTDGLQNCGTYNKIEDLRWAFNAFIKEYLK